MTIPRYRWTLTGMVPDPDVGAPHELSLTVRWVRAEDVKAVEAINAELLDALKALGSPESDGSSCFLDCFLQADGAHFPECAAARAAIAKAEGR